MATLAFAGASVVIGICLLVTASLTLDAAWERLDQTDCDWIESFRGSLCNDLRFWKLASALGILASLLQILGVMLICAEKFLHWRALHVAIFLCTAVAFGLSLYVQVFRTDHPYQDKVKAFAVFSLIDMIFAIMVAVFVYSKVKRVDMHEVKA